MNHINGTGATPTMEAVSTGQYDIALVLLEHGANYKIYMPRSNERLIHIVALQDDRNSPWSTEQTAEYAKLVKWLEDHDESVEQAKADIKRWQSWNTTPDEYRRKLDAEIAEREARETREKAAAANKKP